MATEFHSPVSQAVRPEGTVEVLERYRNSQRRGRAEYAAMVESSYDLITDF